MKKFILVLLIYFFANVSLAQSPFLNISYDSALVLAKEKNKLVMVYIPSADCKECNSFLMAALELKKNAGVISSNFIPVKTHITFENTGKFAWMPADSEVDFGIFYIDVDENLVYVSTVPEDFAKEAAFVIEKTKKIKAVKDLEVKYFAGNKKSLTELEKLIRLKSEVGQDNYLLLNSYANQLPRDSFNSVRVLRFLLRQAPTLESKADSILRISPRTERVWNSLSLEERNKYDERVFAKSLQLASKFKDEGYLERLAEFSAGHYEKEKDQLDAYEGVFMSYFMQVADTARFMMVATSYYNRLVENLPRELFTADWEKAVTKSQVQLQNVSGVVTMPTLRAPSFYADKLGGMANFFYLFDHDNAYLPHALNWAKTASELYGMQRHFYIYALLLRKAGKNEEADALEKRSKEKMKISDDEWKVISEMMKAGPPAP